MRITSHLNQFLFGINHSQQISNTLIIWARKALFFVLKTMEVIVLDIISICNEVPKDRINYAYLE